MWDARRVSKQQLHANRPRLGIGGYHFLVSSYPGPLQWYLFFSRVEISLINFTTLSLSFRQASLSSWEWCLLPSLSPCPQSTQLNVGLVMFLLSKISYNKIAPYWATTTTAAHPLIMTMWEAMSVITSLQTVTDAIPRRSFLVFFFFSLLFIISLGRFTWSLGDASRENCLAFRMLFILVSFHPTSLSVSTGCWFTFHKLFDFLRAW